MSSLSTVLLSITLAVARMGLQDSRNVHRAAFEGTDSLQQGRMKTPDFRYTYKYIPYYHTSEDFVLNNLCRNLRQGMRVGV